MNLQPPHLHEVLPPLSLNHSFSNNITHAIVDCSSILSDRILFCIRIKIVHLITEHLWMDRRCMIIALKHCVFLQPEWFTRCSVALSKIRFLYPLLLWIESEITKMDKTVFFSQNHNMNNVAASRAQFFFNESSPLKLFYWFVRLNNFLFCIFALLFPC